MSEPCRRSDAANWDLCAAARLDLSDNESASSGQFGGEQPLHFFVFASGPPDDIRVARRRLIGKDRQMEPVYRDGREFPGFEIAPCQNVPPLFRGHVLIAMSPDAGLISSLRARDGHLDRSLWRHKRPKLHPATAEVPFVEDETSNSLVRVDRRNVQA